MRKNESERARDDEKRYGNTEYIVAQNTFVTANKYTLTHTATYRPAETEPNRTEIHGEHVRTTVAGTQRAKGREGQSERTI